MFIRASNEFNIVYSSLRSRRLGRRGGGGVGWGETQDKQCKIKDPLSPPPPPNAGYVYSNSNKTYQISLTPNANSLTRNSR